MAGSLGRRLTRVGNRFGVWLYRRFDGRGSGSHRVLMITVPGRKTGVPRSTCVAYLTVPDGLLVWGSGSGSPQDPDWFRNLRRADIAEVQVGADRRRMRPRELKGEERTETWKSVVLTQVPRVERYEHKAGRTIPVAVLQPLPGDGPAADHGSTSPDRIA